jgi:hypothetical protein
MKFREMRYPCECPAEAVSNAATLSVVIVNISPQGARIARADSLSPGDSVELRMLGGRHAARVRWQRQGMAGLRFDLLIGRATLAGVRKSTGGKGPRSGWNLHLRELGAGGASRAG